MRTVDQQQPVETAVVDLGDVRVQRIAALIRPGNCVVVRVEGDVVRFGAEIRRAGATAEDFSAFLGMRVVVSPLVPEDKVYLMNGRLADEVKSFIDHAEIYVAKR